jgi:hypothetical protein
MKKIILLTLLLFTSCQLYVTEIKDVTLSGKYVVSKLEITSVDQSSPRIEKFFIGQTYVNNALGHPFNKIQINNFYIHFDYSTVRMDWTRTESGRDIWGYGMYPNEIFYKIFGTTPFHSGDLQFDYVSKDGTLRTLRFTIEDDGLETLQLKLNGFWSNGQFGQKQTMTMSLTRVGP